MQTTVKKTVRTLRLRARAVPAQDRILTPEATQFVADLVAAHRRAVQDLLARRRERQARSDAGERPGFLPETLEVRKANWTVAPVPDDLLERKVEITGPVERKMIINALNSGADVFMADFEDATSPTWSNLIEGQANLADAVRRTIRFDDPRTGKTYRLGEDPATLLVRPRGWHLPEAHLLFEGEPAPAPLVDFGLYLFHNAHALVDAGTGPYFYLPKLQSRLEARLWNDVFVHAQDALGLPRGTIKATVLIETLPAAFEMDEILYELREHSAGLNCGRWDYIFSFIKTFRNHADFVLPDRAQVTMDQPFLRAYTQLCVKTCHRRGVHAIGGMAAQIPIKDDPAANERALERVRADKRREAGDGHDGTWVAHPGLVPIARAVFGSSFRGLNQLEKRREDFDAKAADLLAVPTGTRTEAGLVQNVDVGIRYLDAWLAGSGCVPLYNLMEDAATAEISRSQLWQWIRHGAALADGRRVTPDLVRTAAGRVSESGTRFARARRLFEDLATAGECPDFMTLPAYQTLLELEDLTR